MPCDQIIGDQLVVGLGPEDCATPGVQSPNITWADIPDFSDGASKDYIRKTGRLGRRDNLIRKIPNDQYSDGSFGGSILQQSFGIVLKGIFGVVNTTTIVALTDFEHCFTPEPTGCVCTTTVAFVDPCKSQVITNAVLKELTISGEVQGELAYTASFEGKYPEEVVLVPALLSEIEFEPKTFSLYIDDTITAIDAGIAGMTLDPLCIQSFEITIANELSRRYCLGTLDPNAIISTGFTVTGSLTLEYTCTTSDFLDKWRDEDIQALKVVLEDTDNLLPGGTAPKLVIDLNSIHYDNVQRDFPLSDAATIVITFEAQYNATDDQTIQVCLTNGNDGSMYVA